MNKTLINVKDVDGIVFDFDGVLTNNKVCLDQNGKESVFCSRGDGIAFDALRKMKMPVFIVSTEKNSVVASRARKLKVAVEYGVDNKVEAVKKIAKKEEINVDRMVFVGNDLNDYRAMEMCGFSVCPADGHQKVKDMATVCLSACGGDGVVRELLEGVMQVDLLNLLYPE